MEALSMGVAIPVWREIALGSLGYTFQEAVNEIDS
jgi:hypothetical protein